VATYYDLVPAFERLLQANGGDLEKFYSAARTLAKLPKAERQRRLKRNDAAGQASRLSLTFQIPLVLNDSSLPRTVAKP